MCRVSLQDGDVLPADLVAALRPRLNGVLIALDFDGTLSAIVPDPMTARSAPGAVGALVALADAGARIAVITGRDARTVLRLGGLDAIPRLSVAGLYGAESWSGGELTTRPAPESIARLRERLASVVAAHTVDPRVWIEDKGLSLVVHARMTDDWDAALAAVRGPVTDLAHELGLEPHDGRGVLEIRLPGYDKGGVLRRLAAETPDAAVLFAGDDLGDLPAFRVVHELRAAGRLAWSVAVHSDEAPELVEAADVSVDGPEGVVGLLAELADLAQASASS
jgi:trehalose 6-phosphate phosphatase